MRVNTKKKTRKRTRRQRGGQAAPMKVAILFAGRIKGYTNVLENLLKIKETYKPTFFCSLNKKIKSNYISKFCDTLGITDEQLKLERTSVAPDYFYTIKPQFYDVESKRDMITNYYSLLYHTQQAFRLAEAYQTKHSMKFDCILYYRADIETAEPLVLTFPKENTIYIPTYEGDPHEHANKGGIACGMYYGNYEVMKSVCNLVDKVKDITEKDGVPFGVPETSFKKMLDNEKIAIQRFQYKFGFHISRTEPNAEYNSVE